MPQFTVGVDVIDGRDIRARNTQGTSVEAKATLQQVAPEAHTSAVANGEEQILLHQRDDEVATPEAGLGGGGHRLPVNGEGGEPR
ncbi:unannotated protein [freshwater metagenome]|uniref:Unannotated protein n=1 Tax=freshwater metagenome TaxID=449393 RepID=A0A6J7RG00_9ZZZZ